LEALAAEDGSPLGWTEWNGGLLPASRTCGLSFDFRITVSLPRCRSCAKDGYALGLASLATFRFVLELLIMKEKLFPGSENEIIPTVYALEHFVLKIH
jgi:hypothetical protein